MMKIAKQFKVFAVTLIMLMVLFMSGTDLVHAGGEEGDIYEGGEITGSEFVTGFDQEDGYYPASLRYAIEQLEFKVAFADGKTENVEFWQSDVYGNDTDYRYIAYGPKTYKAYVLRFYDQQGNQVKITDDCVPFGTFTAKITMESETEPIVTKEIKIIPANEGTASNNTASFSSSNSKKHEETWYPISLEKGKEYVFAAGEGIDYNFFAGIWTKNTADGTVQRLDQGFGYSAFENAVFPYTLNEDQEIYLVIGEKSKYNPLSGKMSWMQKKTLSSLSITPANSYKVWNQDINSIPVTVTYTDGTTEKITSWDSTYTLINAPGGEEYINVNCFKATTVNGDVLYLGAYENDAWVDCDAYNSWKPGQKLLKVYAGADNTIIASANITVTAPTMKTLSLKEGYVESYSVSTAESYYSFVSEKSEKIEVVNSGADDLYLNVYRRNSSNDPWEYKQGSLISGGKSRNISIEAGEEYLFILYAKNGTAKGTLGVYVVGKTKSATMPQVNMKEDEYLTWGKLPVTVNFVGSDGTTPVGSQLISSWSTRYGQSYALAQTKYNETIYYELYNGSEKIKPPVISEEILEYIGGETDPEVINMILAELGIEGGLDGLMLKPGTYTVKFYLNSVSEASQIGTGTVVITKGACAAHTWDSGKIAKAATCTAAGEKLYTCTVCSTTKTEAIAKKGHAYSSSYTVDKKATATADGSKSKHCTRCSAKTSVTPIYKASGAKLSTASYTYDGKTKSPKVYVNDSKGKTISSSNYTISTPSGRKNVGQYTYKITFKNEYSGTKSLTLKINPKGTSLSKVSAAKKAFTVKWKKQSDKMKSSRISGYEIQYSTSKKFTSPKSKTVSGYKSTSKKITSLKSKKTYYVRIRTYTTVKVNGKSVKLYSGWSKVKSVKTK